MRSITDADRPDPGAGKQASAAYAENYAQHHRTTGNTFAYRLGEADLLLIDSLLDDYTLLDVGCATGGYLRLLRNHRRVLGIDFAVETIRAANELRREFNLARIDFEVALYETFEHPEPFDVVRLRGTFGSYQPWPASLGAIARTRRLLRDGGIVIASHVSPPNLVHALKAVLLPRTTLAISHSRFLAMWESRGFSHLVSLRMPHATITLFRKGNDAQGGQGAKPSAPT